MNVVLNDNPIVQHGVRVTWRPVVLLRLSLKLFSHMTSNSVTKNIPFPFFFFLFRYGASPSDYQATVEVFSDKGLGKSVNRSKEQGMSIQQGMFIKDGDRIVDYLETEKVDEHNYSADVKFVLSADFKYFPMQLARQDLVLVERNLLPIGRTIGKNAGNEESPGEDGGKEDGLVSKQQKTRVVVEDEDKLEAGEEEEEDESILYQKLTPRDFMFYSSLEIASEPLTVFDLLVTENNKASMIFAEYTNNFSSQLTGMDQWGDRVRTKVVEALRQMVRGKSSPEDYGGALVLEEVRE